ncbi:MAG: hypothetical protein ABMB14_08395, partial [Myxococcota bacterium]
MRWWVWLVGATAGCVPMEPSGNPLAPVHPVRAPAAVPAAGAAPAPRGPASVQGDFDFEAEDREPSAVLGGPAAVDPVELQARLLGVPPDAVRRGPTEVQTAAPVDAAPIWDPSVTLPDVSFGVRVMAVVTDLQPPRAMLALADGREIVVTPGAMVPEARLVVLAIGRNAVQLATVTPNGFYAKVSTETIAVLAPPSPAAQPPG